MNIQRLIDAKRNRKNELGREYFELSESIKSMLTHDGETCLSEEQLDNGELTGHQQIILAMLQRQKWLISEGRKLLKDIRQLEAAT